MTTDSAPWLKTTVDQDRGPHSSGARYTQLIDVITSYSDYSPVAWETLGPDDREWWTDLLADIHAARVALAELPQEARERAEEKITDTDCDLEQCAGVIRRAVEEETG